MDSDDRWWVHLPHGDRLHAIGARYVDDDHHRTVCGRPVDWLEHGSGRWRWRTRRCIVCCAATGIPGGYGPPDRDPRARRRLGLPPMPR